VAWITGSPPTSLQLRLPPGPRRPPLQARPLSLPLPAITANPGTSLAISTLGPRGPETAIAASILNHQIQRTLRHELGLSYATGVTYERLDGSTAHVLLTADCAPERAAEAGEAMVAALRKVADSGPPPEDLARAQAAMRAGVEQSGRRLVGIAELERASYGHLLGHQEPSAEDVLQRCEALTANQVAGIVANLAWTAIMLAPPGLTRGLPTSTPFRGGRPGRWPERRWRGG
jgi:zinc protease